MLLRITITLICLVVFSSGVSAVELKLVRLNGIDIVEVNGEIKSGDQSTIAQFISRHTAMNDIYLAFNSPGGDLFEAVKIGKYIHSMNFNTLISQNSICYSACFFSFIGGVNRNIEPHAKLGVHQFYGGKGTPGYVESTTQYLTAQLLEYTARMGVNIETMKFAFQTPPQSMYVFNQNEIEAYSIAQRIAENVKISDRELWQKNGWSVLLDNNDHSCQMSKIGKRLLFIIVIASKTHPYIIFFSDNSSMQLEIDKSSKKEINLLFDHTANLKPSARVYNKNDNAIISVKLNHGMFNDIITKRTLQLSLDNKILEDFDLKGAVEAYKQLEICYNLINY